MSLAAGKMRERVTFDTASVAQGASGEEVVTWVPGITVWGQLEVVGGSERQVADQILPDHDARITVRWSSEVLALTPKHRARIGSRIFNIVHLPPRPAGVVDCVILCHSGTNAG